LHGLAQEKGASLKLLLAPCIADGLHYGEVFARPTGTLGSIRFKGAELSGFLFDATRQTRAVGVANAAVRKLKCDLCRFEVRCGEVE
jgi:hypothetical protein